MLSEMGTQHQQEGARQGPSVPSSLQCQGWQVPPEGQAITGQGQAAWRRSQRIVLREEVATELE